MKQFTDDAYATMLLASQIDPSHAELVLPLSDGEWHRLRETLRQKGCAMGDLLSMDLSGMMLRLGLSEEEAYRLRVLLDRSLPLSYALERFTGQGIQVVTYGQMDYPRRLADRLGTRSPAQLYLAGAGALFRQRAVGVVGGKVVTPETESCLHAIVRFACGQGLTVVTDQTRGAGAEAAGLALDAGGRVIEAMAGNLMNRTLEPGVRKRLASKAAALFSLVHPDAPFTRAHAIARSKMVYGLCDAVFVLGCDEEGSLALQGALEALRNRYCAFVYAPPTAPTILFERGATPLPNDLAGALPRMETSWRQANAVQLSFFGQ